MRIGPVTRPDVVRAARTLFWVGLLAFVAVLMVFLAWKRVLITDADDLSFHLLCQDLFRTDFPLRTWRWCDSFYLVPDQLLFVPLDLTLRNPLHAYLAFHVILFFLIVAAGAALHARLEPKRGDLLAFTALFAFTLLFLVYGQKDFVRKALAWIGWHGGILVPGLGFLILALWQARPGTPLKGWAFIGGLSFLSTFSDRLFCVQFAGPASACWLWLAFRRRTTFVRALGLAAVTGAGCYAAIYAQQFLARQHWLHTRKLEPVTWKQRKAGAKLFLKLLPDMFADTPFSMALLFLTMALCVSALLACWQSRALEPGSLEDRQHRDREWMAVFYPVSVLCCFLAPIYANLIQTDGRNGRFFYTIVVPGAVLALGWAMRAVPKITSPHPVILTGGLLTFMAVSIGWTARPAYKSFRKEPLSFDRRGEAVSLTKALTKYDLHCGYAGFWETKVINMAHPQHHATQLLPNGVYFPWLTNVAWELTRGRPDLGRGIPHYDYIFASSRTQYALGSDGWWERFGPPVEVLDYGADKILVYNRPSDVGFRNFTRLPILVEGRFPLPTSTQRPELRTYKPRGTRLNGKGVVRLHPGQELALPLQKPIPPVGHVLEISLAANHDYDLAFCFQNQVVGEAHVKAVAPRLIPDLNPFYFLLEELADAPLIDAVVVKAVSGPESYHALGHIFLYPDSRKTPKEVALEELGNGKH